MGYKRVMVTDGQLAKIARAGDTLANPVITVVAADANDTVTIAKMSGGVVQYTGFTAGRTLTTETAANIAAALPEMDIGDAFNFKVSVVPAFAGTWSAGAGITIKGKATVPASTEVNVLVVRTGAATFDWNTL